jgi:hypothetical protein
LITERIAMSHKIELTGTALDAWRAELDQLIARAPGLAVDIAWHLQDATKYLSDLMMRRVSPVDEFGFTHQAPLIDIDLSTPARCKRLAYAMGISVQSVYRHLQAMVEADGIGKAEALNRLEPLYPRGADQ